MIYLEMARDEDHGGGTWGFTNCIWAPTRKENGALWPFWSKVAKVKEGDVILHLRGITPNASFLGYSIASGDGFETSKRPPSPGDWAFAKAFYRADLRSFTEFHEPVSLSGVFSARRSQLGAYFDANRQRRVGKANIFFVRQSGRLQCLNGAYLSEVDEDLLDALFGSGSRIVEPSEQRVVVSVETGFQISAVRTRLGQTRFAREVKALYRNQCCFPDCKVDDPQFLIGAHIARWSDNERLRGHLGNGLCLCLLHDKAFELGLFTLDQHFRIFVNPKKKQSDSHLVKALLEQQGQVIRLSEVAPLDESLLEHWIRVDIDPWFSDSQP